MSKQPSPSNGTFHQSCEEGWGLCVVQAVLPGETELLRRGQLNNGEADSVSLARHSIAMS